MEVGLPETRKRVEKHTNEELNTKIREQTKRNIEYYRDKKADEISKRIDELTKEWDTERVLEANAATLVVVASVLGSTINKKWHLLSGVVGAFLLQHALQGWCPPLPVIRRAGVRTESEIQEEIYALKQLRGDFT